MIDSQQDLGQQQNENTSVESVGFVDPQHLASYKERLESVYPDSIVNIVELATSRDVSYNLLKIAYSGQRVIEKNTVTSLIIKPDSELFSDIFRILDPEATRYTFFPTGVDNLASHEAEHFQAADRIKNGTGLVNKFGVSTDFSFCLQILVYPMKRNIEDTEIISPQTHVGTVMMYGEDVSVDERLCINLEVLLAALDSDDGLSPTDKDQIQAIVDKQSEETPMLKAFIASLGDNITTDKPYSDRFARQSD